MSPLVGRFDGIVAKAQAGGLQLAWEERALLTLRRNYLNFLEAQGKRNTEKDNEKSLTLNHLAIVFLLLVPGHVLAAISFGTECMCKKQRVQTSGPLHYWR